MKLENIQSKLQSSFILLQFVCLSILHYTTIGVPDVTIKQLQCVQNIATKVVL